MQFTNSTFTEINLPTLNNLTHEPGTILIYDYRPEDLKNENLSINNEIDNNSLKELKVMQWNIERGYELDKILKELEYWQPDIAILQEVDIYCKRSGNVDQMKIIAERMGWLGGFVIEFLELESNLRSERDQGGGYHGNAIFSKFPMTFEKLIHQYQPIKWNLEGSKFKEPRIGQRTTLISTIKINNNISILSYSIHLEVFCGLLQRILQFSEILEHAQKNQNNFPYQLIFGDFNTMAHSIARLAPWLCKDRYRFLSIGFSEAKWWDELLFNHQLNKKMKINLLKSLMPELKNYSKVITILSNNNLIDPWHKDLDITLKNMQYYYCYQGKLDWTCLKGFNTLFKTMGNLDFKASDHRNLNLLIEFNNNDNNNSNNNNNNQLLNLYNNNSLWFKCISLINTFNNYHWNISLGCCSILMVTLITWNYKFY